MTDVPGDLVGVKVAARLLVCHPATVYRLVKRGTLRAWKRPGGRMLLSRAEVLGALVPVPVGKEG